MPLAASVARRMRQRRLVGMALDVAVKSRGQMLRSAHSRERLGNERVNRPFPAACQSRMRRRREIKTGAFKNPP